METLFWYVVAVAAGMIVVALGYTLYSTADIVNRGILGYKAGLLDVPDDDDPVVDVLENRPINTWPDAVIDLGSYDDFLNDSEKQAVNTWADTRIEFDSSAPPSSYLLSYSDDGTFEGQPIDDEEQTAVYDSGVVDLRKLQQEHRAWRTHNFPCADDWQPLVGVSEELGEAAFAFIRIAATIGRIDHGFLKQAQCIRVSEDHRAEIVDAVGDLLLYVVDFANRLDIDLADAIKTTWAEVSVRDWQRNKVDGK
jgi:NTP pyrophosphatase (non-canonical NTP hydrolase)